MGVLGDITMKRGDSYPHVIVFKKAGAPVDLTGYSFIMTVDKLVAPPDDTTMVFEVVGVIDADPTTGRVAFTPSTTDTDIDPRPLLKPYFYDMQYTSPTGEVRTFADFKFAIVQDKSK